MPATIKISLNKITPTQALVELEGPNKESERHTFDFIWVEPDEWKAVSKSLELYPQGCSTWPQEQDIVEKAEALGLFVDGKPAGNRLEIIGQALYQRLFGSEAIRNLWSRLLAQAGNDDIPVVQFCIHDEGSFLQSYPWELLHDGQDFLFAGRRAFMVRHINFEQAAPPIKLAVPLKTLLVDPRPDLPAEDYPVLPRSDRARLNKIADLYPQQFSVVDLDTVSATTPATLSKIHTSLMTASDIHILHIGVHGGYGWRCSCGNLNTSSKTLCQRCKTPQPQESREQGYLAFQNAEGAAQWVSGEELGRQLTKRDIQIVTLSACKSGLAAGASSFNSVAGALVKQGIPGVVAMQFSIDEQSAEVFAHDFYLALAGNRSLPEAVAEARLGLDAISTESWYRIVLYLRSPIESFDSKFIPSILHQPSPIPITEHFIGRNQEVRQLREIIEQEGCRALVGNAGVGKTTLAATVVRQTVAEERIFWYRFASGLTDAESVMWNLAAFLARLGDREPWNLVQTETQQTQAMPLSIKANAIASSLQKCGAFLCFDDCHILADSLQVTPDTQTSSIHTLLNTLIQRAGNYKILLIGREAVPGVVIQSYTLNGLFPEAGGQLLKALWAKWPPELDEKLNQRLEGNPELITRFAAILAKEQADLTFANQLLETIEDYPTIWDYLNENLWERLSQSEQMALKVVSAFRQDALWTVLRPVLVELGCNNVRHLLEELRQQSILKVSSKPGSEQQAYSIHETFGKFCYELLDEPHKLHAVVGKHFSLSDPLESAYHLLKAEDFTASLGTLLKHKQILLHTGKVVSALGVLTQIIEPMLEEQPGLWVDACQLRGEWQQVAAEYAQALESFDQALMQVDALLRRAQLNRKIDETRYYQGRFQESINSLTQAYQLLEAADVGENISEGDTDEIASLKRMETKLKHNLLTLEEQQTDFIDPRNASPDVREAITRTRNELESVQARLRAAEETHREQQAQKAAPAHQEEMSLVEYWLAYAYRRLGNMPVAAQHAESCLAKLGQGHPAYRVGAHNVLAVYRYYVESPQRCWQTLSEAMRIVKAYDLHNSPEAAGLHVNFGVYYLLQRNYAESEKSLTTAIDIAEKIGFVDLIEEARYNLSGVWMLRCKWAEANAYMDEMLAGSKSAFHQAFAQNNKGYIAYLTGHWAEAQNTLLTAITFAESQGLNVETFQALVYIGKLYKDRLTPADWQKGLSYLEQAWQLKNDPDKGIAEADGQLNVECLAALAEARARLGQADQAMADAQAAFKMAQEQGGDTLTQGFAAMALGVAYTALGDRDQAESMLRQAGELVSGECFWKNVALLRLGEMYAHFGEKARAGECFDAAIRQFEAIGSLWSELAEQIKISAVTQL